MGELIHCFVFVFSARWWRIKSTASCWVCFIGMLGRGRSKLLVGRLADGLRGLETEWSGVIAPVDCRVTVGQLSVGQRWKVDGRDGVVNSVLASVSSHHDGHWRRYWHCCWCCCYDGLPLQSLSLRLLMPGESASFSGVAVPTAINEETNNPIFVVRQSVTRPWKMTL